MPFQIPSDPDSPESNKDKKPKLFKKYLEEKKKKRNENSPKKSVARRLEPWSPQQSFQILEKAVITSPGKSTRLRPNKRKLEREQPQQIAKKQKKQETRKRNTHETKKHETKKQTPQKLRKQKTKKQETELKNAGKPDKKPKKKTRKIKLSEENKQRLEELRQQRDKKIQERIEAMSAGEKSDMLFKIAKTLPVLVFSMLEQTDVDDGDQQPKEKLSKVPDWCVCQNCREMPTIEERQCCKRKPEACIAHQPEMDVLILEPMVLRLQRNYRNDIFALDEDEDDTKGNRHAAYRQFTLWQHGFLGQGNRKVIPSCCVWRIRDQFPDPFNQYVGFKSGRLA